MHLYLSQANLAIQENRLAIAMLDLQKAQTELDAKQAELDVVQAAYEKAMTEKQVSSSNRYILVRLYYFHLLKTIAHSESFLSLSNTSYTDTHLLTIASKCKHKK